MEWEPHVIRRGEHISGLAHARGVTVETVWTHPDNAALRAKRSNPDVLAPADIVWLPIKPAPKWLAVTIGGTNTFVAKIPRHTVKIKIRGQDGKPLAGVAYQVDKGKVAPPGKTDGEGTATFDVDVTTKSVVVTIPEKKLAIPVLVGDLDPVSSISGAIGRLRNLGYGLHPTEVDNVDDAHYAFFLLSWFQRDHGLPATGKLDQATQDKLSEVGGADRAGPQ